MSHTEPLFGFDLQQKKSLNEFAATLPGPTAIDAAVITTGTVAPARLPNATTSAKGVVNQAAARADSAAADIAALNTIFNDLLAKLRTAGILAT